MVTKKSIGIEIKAIRESLGLSRDELAEKIGVSRCAVQHWEQGIKEPGVIKYKKIKTLEKVSKSMRCVTA